MNKVESIFLEQYNALFIPIPKVASSSFKFIFADMLNLEIHDTIHKIIFPSFDLNMIRDDIFIFAFVRNPWARLVSCYFDKIKNETTTGDTYFTRKEGVANCLSRYSGFKKDMTFSQFVNAISLIPDDNADAHFRSQSSFVENIGNMSFIGKLENLDDDLGRVFLDLNIPPRKPLKIKSTITKDYRDMYDERTQKIVYKRYQNDIENFGYSF